MRRSVAAISIAVFLALAYGPGAQADRLAMARLPSNHDDTALSAAKVAVRTCRVTSIHDGDSMRVRCPGFKDTLRIRLDQIDAPELDQAHGVKSRDFLRSMCPVGREAVVHDLGPDTYNRRLGRVYCNDVDANAAMVESGAAWVYDYHATDKSLYPLQDAARSQRRGLWGDRKNPVAPWDFRYRQRR